MFVLLVVVFCRVGATRLRLAARPSLARCNRAAPTPQLKALQQEIYWGRARRNPKPLLVMTGSLTFRYDTRQSLA